MFSGCGIAGVIRFHNADGPRPGLAEVQAMTAMLAHRGPDDQRLWHGQHVTFGHRRLSIVGLGPAGVQPMARGPLTITYNGELYNFRQLRRELGSEYAFDTQTDTEVVLRAWQRWGPAALQRFDGMFAFALWDERFKRLYLVRDRLGMKPLYYFIGNGFFVFASEVEALLASGLVPRLPGLAAIHQQLLCSTTLRVDAGSTVVQGVRALEPGEMLTIEPDGRRRATSYWSLPEGDPRDEYDQDELAGQLLEIFDRAVGLMSEADVPVAAFLSGGLDSSAIVARASALRPVRAITTRYGDGSEASSVPNEADADLAFSKLLAADLGRRIEHHIVTQRSAVTVADIDEVCDLAAITDDVRHLNILANYRGVRDLGLRVVLNGQGADELMAGYVGQPGFGEHILDVRSPSASTINSLPGSRQAPNLSRAVLDGAERAQTEVLDFHRGLVGSPLTRAHRLLMHCQLGRVVQFEDFLAMRCSVEARFPFLDHHLVEWAFAIPFGHHVTTAELLGKALLRRALAPHLPATLLSRPKQKFPYPAAGPLRRTLAELVLEHRTALREDTLVTSLFAEVGDVGQVGEDGQESVPTLALWLQLVAWRWHEKLVRGAQPTAGHQLGPSATSLRAATGDPETRRIVLASSPDGDPEPTGPRTEGVPR